MESTSKLQQQQEIKMAKEIPTITPLDRPEVDEVEIGEGVGVEVGEGVGEKVGDADVTNE